MQKDTGTDDFSEMETVGTLEVTHNILLLKS